jgi:hypothetical protein
MALPTPNEPESDVACEVARPIQLPDVDERVAFGQFGVALPERSPQRLMQTLNVDQPYLN